jgi:predicted Zn-dependent protease
MVLARFSWRLVLISLFVTLILFKTIALGQQNPNLESSLPPLRVHPLPESLQNWQYKSEYGDYLPEIETNLVGSLIWSTFPIKVYIEKPTTPLDTSKFSDYRFAKWVEVVQEAITAWTPYLPLTEVETPENADIIINRKYPPVRARINPETGLYDLPRANSAQTRYKFYFSKDEPRLLLHRMTIDVSPDQTDDYILAATRHEIGHALGIWGHSDLETDVMYFSQVRQSPNISPRDVNTLQKIYQQPTRLGWSLPK